VYSNLFGLTGQAKVHSHDQFVTIP